MKIPAICRFVSYYPHNRFETTHIYIIFECPRLDRKVKINHPLKGYQKISSIHRSVKKIECVCKSYHKIDVSIIHQTRVFWVCENKKNYLEVFVNPFCDICAKPLKSDYRHCYRCHNNDNGFFFNQLRSLSIYCKWKDKLYFNQMIKALKNEGTKRTLKSVKIHINQLLKFYVWGLDTLYPDFKDIDYIVPIPMHPEKVKIRGYNQSELLAESLKEYLEKPILSKLIEKIRKTDSQRNLNEEQRRLNVQGCYQLNHHIIKNSTFNYDNRNYKLQGRKFLVIDDVVTTCATVNEYCRILRELKPKQIYVYSLARNMTEDMEKLHETVRHKKSIL